MEWKTKDGSYENTLYAQFDTFVEGMFEKTRLLDIIKNFICFTDDSKILGADETITTLCEDIIKHYEENRQYELTGKAMIVAYSREIAMSIYEKLLDLRPQWGEKLGVVMTENNKDPEEWRKVIGNKRRRDELAAKFKDNDYPMKIAIVVDMLL